MRSSRRKQQITNGIISPSHVELFPHRKLERFLESLYTRALISNLSNNRNDGFSTMKRLKLSYDWLLVAILVGGLLVRVIGLNWDDYARLHPDERYMTDIV